MDLMKFERIVVDVEDLGKIVKWEEENHKNLEPHFALTEAVIEVTGFDQPHLHKHELYYKLDEERQTIVMKVFMNDQHMTTVEMEGAEFVSTYRHPIIEDGYRKMSVGKREREMHNQNASALINIVSLNAYMVYFDGTEFIDGVEERTHVKKKQKHGAGKNAKKTRSIVRLNKRYTVTIPEDIEDKQYKVKKARQRHVDGFMVRGHMRFNPKTGLKDIPVKSYPKGNLRNIEPKTYKIT